MATYFHVNASELQGGGGGGGDGGMQTLYLMNPNYAPYLDHHTNNTLLLNPVNLSSHAPPPPPYDSNHQPLVGIPLPAAEDNIHQYDLWSSIPQIPSAQNNDSQTHMASLAAAFNNSAPSGLLRPLASVPSRQQGLSLSLSSQDQQGGGGQVTVVSAGDLKRVSESSLSPSSVSVVSSGNIMNSGMQILTGSKYLKAAQELLDEVVKVENLITLRTDHRRRRQHSPDSLVKENIKKPNDRESDDDDDVDDVQESNGAGESKIPLDLTTSQRQELQVKKAKLMNMLDEVEQRYKQYHQQMQSVVSAFDQAAGFGSAKSYTALALRTISKQFRSLKDAISTQIKAATKKLGEDECLGAKGEGSRLRFVDQQLRQQRAFQHLGMMQQHAWRPQRGLPERAVTILRAWLFEHFLHPYPKDLDKQQLAKQTGLTRSQVSNWFINARVRLWKPMVEDMYLEEVKEQQERNGNSENTSKTGGDSKELPPSKAKSSIAITQQALASSSSSPTHPHQLSNSTISTSPNMGSGNFQQQQQTGFNLIGPSDRHLQGFLLTRQQKKPRNNPEMQNSPSSISNDPGGGGGFGTYSIMGPDHHRYHHHQLAAGQPYNGSNGFSLTLGLPHGESLSLSPGQNIDQLGRGLGLGSSEQADFCGLQADPQLNNSHSTAGGGAYEAMEIQNRKRFAAQLLPDFFT